MEKKNEIKVRNWLAVEAFQKSGSGKHGGSKKARRKASRKEGKRQARGEW